MKTNYQRIAQQKLANIDALSIEATDALYYVQECQAVVDSLELKSQQFSGYLNDAEQNRDTALRNLNEAQQLSAQTQGIYDNLLSMQQQSQQANIKIKQTSQLMTSLVHELNLSSQVVDKLAALIMRKKALNPLISDELVEQVNKATEDCNIAVTATLKALQSCFVSIASIEEGTLVTGLGVKQSGKLYDEVSGEELDVVKEETDYYQSSHELQNISQDLSRLRDDEQSLFTALVGSAGEDKDNGDKQGQKQLAELAAIQQVLAKLQQRAATSAQKKSDLEAKLKAQLGALKQAEGKLQDAKTEAQSEAANKALEKEQGKFEKLELDCLEAEQKLQVLLEEVSDQKQQLHSLQGAVQSNQQALMQQELENPPPVKLAQSQYNRATAQLQQLQQQLVAAENELVYQQAILAQSDPGSASYKKVETKIADLQQQVNQFKRSQIPAAQKSQSHALRVMLKSQQQYRMVEQKLQTSIDKFHYQSQLLQVFTDQQQPTALLQVAHDIYSRAKQKYQRAADANKRVTKQLSEAQATLLAAQNRLQSLQAGLSAAKASTQPL